MKPQELSQHFSITNCKLKGCVKSRRAFEYAPSHDGKKIADSRFVTQAAVSLRNGKIIVATCRRCLTVQFETHWKGGGGARSYNSQHGRMFRPIRPFRPVFELWTLSVVGEISNTAPPITLQLKLNNFASPLPIRQFHKKSLVWFLSVWFYTPYGDLGSIDAPSAQERSKFTGSKSLKKSAKLILQQSWVSQNNFIVNDAVSLRAVKATDCRNG